MSHLWIWLPLIASAAILVQHPVPAPSPEADVMLAAASRDESMLAGGIGSAKWTGRGTVVVEPLARLTPSGEWKSLPCATGDRKSCLKFEREYLSKPHAYVVITPDGKGATISAAPTTLSECYDFGGTGTYSGAPVARSAIAASSDQLFAASTPPRSLGEEEGTAVRKALASLVPKQLDSTQQLRIFALRLEGHDVLVVQRAYADIATPQDERPKFIFALGTINQGSFNVLHWKQNTEDEEERLLGTICLKSGREFLISVVSDPESHSFRVYGIRDGHLALIYSGGGSSC
jgi:hypothetical protein